LRCGKLGIKTLDITSWLIIIEVGLWKTMKKKKEKKYRRIEESKYRKIMRRERQLLKIKALFREGWRALSRLEPIEK